jgi:hypothetical protein
MALVDEAQRPPSVSAADYTIRTRMSTATAVISLVMLNFKKPWHSGIIG